MKSLRSIVLLASVLLLHPVRAELDPLSLLPQEDWDRYSAIEWENLSLVRRHWPAHKVEKLITYFRHEATKNDGMYWGHAADHLVFLGDEATIDRCIKYGVGPPLQFARNPTVISKLAPLLYKDEAQGSNILRPSASAQTAATILEILRYTPEFSSEVADWATSGTLCLANYSSISLGIVRKWWQANETHFKSGAYGEVKPGGHFPTDEELFPGMTNLRGPTPPPPPAGKTPSSPTPTIPSVYATAPPTAAPGDSMSVPSMVIVSVASLALATWLWIRGGSRKR
jgi:hypothetical protein